MTQLAIQFLIRFVRDVNTPDRMREFSGGLHDYITKTAKLGCLWGGQGGMATVYGIVYLDDGDITVAERNGIADWIREQRIDCTVTFGDPEPIDSYDLMRDLDELVFEVRNLTINDREEGLRYHQSVLDRMRPPTGEK